jgi:hypothetical protein
MTGLMLSLSITLSLWDRFPKKSRQKGRQNRKLVKRRRSMEDDERRRE